MNYNFQLYYDFCKAAQELNLELESCRGGGYFMVKLPNNLNKIFCAYLWTPLNKLEWVLSHDEPHDRIDAFRYNHSDFHLEFCTCDIKYGTYWFFPELLKEKNKITKDDIKSAIEKMLDVENFEKYAMMAKLLEPDEELFDE